MNFRPRLNLHGFAIFALLASFACGPRQAGAHVPVQVVAAALPPRIFLHSPAILQAHKARWRAERNPALARLLDDARRALEERPFSVVEKQVVPPSGDKHDFLSLAPYAWPDPTRPGGVPYVIRDGLINPERDSIADHRYLSHLASLCETLSLAYFFTGEESYARHAVLLLRTFFVEPATRMNPNLNFGQGVRGKEPGRPAGIIDSAPIARIVDGFGLLLGSAALSLGDRQAILNWMRAYLSWLRESELGVREGQARNNHGTWYDVQVVSLAIATGQLELARETLLFARKRRIGREIEPGGEQPEELRRSNSWHYSIYNLEAFVALAGLGDAVGVDLWHYETPDGRSLRKAIAWLVPSALGKRPWTTPQMGGLRAGELAPVLRAAAARLGDEMFAQAARTLGGDEADRLQLFLDWK